MKTTILKSFVFALFVAFVGCGKKAVVPIQEPDKTFPHASISFSQRGGNSGHVTDPPIFWVSNGCELFLTNVTFLDLMSPRGPNRRYHELALDPPLSPHGERTFPLYWGRGLITIESVKDTSGEVYYPDDRQH